MKKAILFWLSLALLVVPVLTARGQTSSETPQDYGVQRQEAPPAAPKDYSAQRQESPPTGQSSSATPQDNSAQRQELPSTGAILGDFIFIRPFAVIATAIGVVGTVVTLPIAIPSGSTGAVAKKLIAEPFAFTFTRPLGAPLKDTSFPW